MKPSFVFILADDLGYADLARREPGKFRELRDRYAAWHATMPPISPDALASMPYGKSDLAQPS